MSTITLTKVASAFRDNYQKYRIPIINIRSLDISLEYTKNAILDTLIDVSNKFNRIKAITILEADLNSIESEPIEIRYGKVDMYDVDMMIIDICGKYEQDLSYIENVYIYSVYLIINTCGLLQ